MEASERDPGLPHMVRAEQVRGWFAQLESLSTLTRPLGRRSASRGFLHETLGLPLHLQVVIEGVTSEGRELTHADLAAIPFYSLCSGLFLPLSGMQPEKTAYLFGIKTGPPPDAKAKEQLLGAFLHKALGLSLVQKLGCILGDPFLGRPSSFRRDSLLRLLLTTSFAPRQQLLDRLTAAGEIAVLFCQEAKSLRVTPQLTACEVLESLRLLPKQRRTIKFALLRSLYQRCGKLEAYFLTRLILRKAGFGFDYEGALIARSLAERYQVAPEQVAHAIALTDTFAVASALAAEGAKGLSQIRLQPLVAVRPALASGASDELKKYPVWVERKYDGIRLLLHRLTDASGATLCGAYTRNRGDWIELIPGMDTTLKSLPTRSCIIDGELFGTMLSPDGMARPATVYEVHGALSGQGLGVNLRYAAFDLLYLEGRDLTELPLFQRRELLQRLIGPMASRPTPIPLSLAEGQLAQSKADVNRLYQHFRSQGYEGVITKNLQGPYRLAMRDPDWTKKKPLVTLDLVLLGAVLAVTTKEHSGMFGSYVIGARRPDGSFEDVGDVAGVDRQRDLEIQQEIMREGLLTGRRIERASASGVRPGFELQPHIVATIKFEGITKDQSSQRLTLRDPKIALLRMDKGALEADLVQSLEAHFLRQRMG